MALIMEIIKTIAQPIGELAVWLEETYKVDASEIVEKWASLTGMNITIVDGDATHEEVKEMNVNTSKKSKTSKIPKTKEVCQHVYVSGQKAGEQCTTKPKSGAPFCSAHKPKDGDKKKKTVIDNDFASDEDQTLPPEEEKTKKNKKAPKKKEANEVEEKPLKKPKKPKKVSIALENEDSDGEPVAVTTPLLKKKKKQPKNDFDTDEEKVDADLDLTDEDE